LQNRRVGQDRGERGASVSLSPIKVPRRTGWGGKKKKDTWTPKKKNKKSNGGLSISPKVPPLGGKIPIEHRVFTQRGLNEKPSKKGKVGGGGKTTPPGVNEE